MLIDRRPGMEMLSAEWRAQILEDRRMSVRPLTREELLRRQDAGYRTLARTFADESIKSLDVSQRFAITRGVE